MVICAFLFLLAIIIVAGHMLPYGDAYHTFMVVFALALAGVTLIRYLEKKHIPKWIFVLNAIAILLCAFMELGSHISKDDILFVVIGGAVIATVLAVWTIVWEIRQQKGKKNQNSGPDKTKPST